CPQVFPICTRPILRTPYILGSVGRRHPKEPRTERLPIACHGRAALHLNSSRAEEHFCTSHLGHR
ncbi:hypothetical protein CPAR01_11054, partial [Colletotrichum paranaense]